MSSLRPPSNPLQRVMGGTSDISNLRKGRKLAVGSMSDLTIVRKIGEGGSAYVYLARRPGGGNGIATNDGSSSDSNLFASSFLSSTRPQNLFSDSASVGGFGNNKHDQQNDADDKASVMSFALGQNGGNSPGRRKSRRSLLSRMGSRSSSFTNRKRTSSASTSGNITCSDQQQQLVVIKATSTSGSSTRKRQAEKEIEMLQRFRGHPNIVSLYDWSSTKSTQKTKAGPEKRLVVTLCAMEYCPGGSLMDLISERRKVLLSERRQLSKEQKFEPDFATFSTEGSDTSLFRKINFTIKGDSDNDIPPPPPPLPCVSEDCNNSSRSQAFLDFEDILSIFKQVASAIDFIHSQCGDDGSSSSPAASPAASPVRNKGRHYKPVVHRDIKPENILLVPTKVSNLDCSMLPGMDRWRVKICDFGSAVEGRVPLQSPMERNEANEIILTSTTQMYRAPEMIDVHSVEELTEKTDIWSLGCTLYMACFLQNCFEENSNLAILSGKYFDPPDNHPYSETQVQELLNRMLIVDVSRRAATKEVCKCIDAMIAGKRLPLRSSGSKPQSGTIATDAAAPTTPSKTHKPNKSSSLPASPPPPPPPPPRQVSAKVSSGSISLRESSQNGLKQRRKDAIPESVVVDRRSTRAKERSKRYEEASSTNISVDADHIYGDLEGAKIMMQSVPEYSSMHMQRDPRKKSSSRRNDSRNDAAISTDHIYSDLETTLTRSKAKKKKKKSATKSRPAQPYDSASMTSPDLFATDDEWSKLGVNQTEKGSLDDAFDRIKIFSLEDNIRQRATSPDVSCDNTPPLTPTDLSSMASASSEDLFSFSRESPVKKKKGRDPPGRFSVSSSYR